MTSKTQDRTPAKPWLQARALCVKHGPALRRAFALCWIALFFRHAFDYNERFFRVPLLLLLFPAAAGLPLRELARYLGRSPLAWGLAGLPLAACLSGLFCPYPAPRSFGHIVFGWLALSASGFVMRLAFGAGALRFMILGSAAGILGACLWAGVLILCGRIAFDDLLQHHTRLMLFSGYANTLGLMAGFCLAGLGHCIRHRRIVAGLWVDRFTALVLFVILLATQARAALLGVLVCFSLTVIGAARKPWRAVSVCLLAAILCAGAGVMLARHGPLKDNDSYKRMVIMFTDPLRDASARGRLGLWEAAVGAFKQHPLSGAGLRMFAPAHAEYLQAHKEEMVRRYGFVEDVSPRGHAHNLFLGLLSELGLVGFASLTLVFGVIFFSRGAERGSEAQGVRILFAFFLFHGMLEYMLHQTVYGDLFFASAGIFLGSLWRGRQEKAAAKSS